MGAWHKIVISRNPETGYPSHFPICKRCGYIPKKGDVMYVHIKFWRKSNPRRAIDYRCEKCYNEIFFDEGGVKSWMKNSLSIVQSAGSRAN